MSAYSAKFFENRDKLEAADTILAPIASLLKPATVVDLGTATGTWLASAKRMGAQTVRGIDGPWVPPAKRLIAPEEFVEADLEKPLPDLGRFDLAICTEVLEHISAPASVHAVEWLCRSAPVVLFSAAIPLQGGKHHINEAWQSHWAGLFKRWGFDTYDVIRPLIWADGRIPWWYRQNILVMANEAAGKQFGAPADVSFLDRVHPELFVSKVTRLQSRTLKGRVRSFFGIRS